MAANTKSPGDGFHSRSNTGLKGRATTATATARIVAGCRDSPHWPTFRNYRTRSALWYRSIVTDGQTNGNLSVQSAGILEPCRITRSRTESGAPIGRSPAAPKWPDPARAGRRLFVEREIGVCAVAVGASIWY